MHSKRLATHEKQQKGYDCIFKLKVTKRIHVTLLTKGLGDNL